MKKAGFLFLVLMAIAVMSLNAKDPNVLRKIVFEKCLPNYEKNQNPSPCIEVKPDAGYVVLKDINGPLQYLLMPTTHISGIENPLLLDSSTPNFFYLSWQARDFMSKKYGKPIPDYAISLTINSHKGRSQNHFHIHISCISLEARKHLDNNLKKINSRWSPLSGGLSGHKYLARRVTESELAQKSPFIMLAKEAPNAHKRMGDYGLAVVQQSDNSFVLLATRFNPLTSNRASAEEIQDHECAILR